MSLLLDAGACISFERGNPTVRAFLERTLRAGERVRTTTAIVAQVWRGGPKQTRLALLLRGVEEVALTPARARAIGILLGSAASEDIADASLIEAAADGDEILTSDPDDLVHLAERSGKTILVTPVG